jgi:type VI secretion system secreted protein VgrG
MQDYNYRSPHLDLTATHESPLGHGGGVVEYGAHHKTPAEGARFSKIRAEERDAQNRVFVGASDLPAFAAGARFKLDDHPRLGDVDLLLVEVEHRFEQVVGTHGGQGGQGYRNTFRATLAERAYRPPRVTPRPRMHGVITAVTEPAAEGQADCYAKIDGDGRYHVAFYFDTVAPGSRTRPSRPVRMMQPHAGPGYGMHFPLKPGVEVLITFVDGDPDRPIIAGAVPNPATPSPVRRPNALENRIQTVSGVHMVFKDC